MQGNKPDPERISVTKTTIEWCNRPETRGPAGARTWNPIRARLKGASPKARSGTFCTRISPGCTHCYASVINKRFGNGLEFTVPNLEQIEFFIDERILEQPLREKKPCTIFVGDMFDLFHEYIPDAYILRVFSVIAAGPHTFQVLTKRAVHMHNFMHKYLNVIGLLDNCWLGVSVEDQQRALERIPLLQETPASVRFLSVEPQLEHIKLGHDTPEVGWISYLRGFDGCDPAIPGIDWVICGGESGPGARPFNLAWAESLLDQCRAAGVPFFMKQIGSRPVKWMNDGETFRYLTKDRKGGDMSDWPAHLCVREFPSQKAEAVPA
jgi:protein gp37